MELRELTYFVAIFECGSFSAAARLLGVAQPSLSQRIRGLEDSLGTALLHRSVVGDRPKEAGKIFYREAVSLLEQASRIKLSLKGNPPDQHIAVGLPTTVSLHLTVPLVRAIRERFPNIRLKIIESMSGYLSEWLEEGRLDMAILYNMKSSSSFICEHLSTEDLLLITPHRRGKAATQMPLMQAAALPFALPSASHGLRKTIDEYFKAAGVSVKAAIEVDSLVHLKALVVDGSHNTILPLAAVRHEISTRSLSAHRLTDPSLSRNVVIARARERNLIGIKRRIYDITKTMVKTNLRSHLQQR